MVEPIPLLSLNSKGIEGFISSATEFTIIFDRHGGLQKVFMWINSEAFDVTTLARGNRRSILLDNITIDLDKWFEWGIPFNKRFMNTIELYVNLVKDWGLEKLRNKKVLLAYSGGKDSTAALLVAYKLAEELDFKLKVIYVYMPFLESPKNIKFVESVSKRLNLDVEIDIVNPPKWIIKKYLFEYGLPYRRFRWCTYLKTRPMREYRKQYNIDFIVIGDRLWETVKRLKRLASLVFKRNLVKRREVYLIAQLTILDISTIVKEANIIHSDYLADATRVSCVFCPYKACFEFKLDLGDVEDPGLIDSVLRFEWRKWYKRYVDYKSFLEFNLWRYVPRVARMFCKAKNYLMRIVDREGLERLTVDDVVKKHRALWTVNNIPCSKVLSLEELHRMLRGITDSNISIQLIVDSRGRNFH